MRKASLLALFLTVFIDLIGFGMVIPFLPFYAREYGASGFTVGAIVGIYSIMQFFFSPVWGRLSDRIGRRPVLLISLTASCIGYAMFGLARSLEVLFLSRVIAGVGGANIGTAQAYIADVTSDEERARGMGLIGAAFGIGFILGPPLSGILAAYGTSRGFHGNSFPGAAAAALSLVALTIAFFALGESRPADLTPRRSALPPQFDRKLWREIATHAVIGASILAIFLSVTAVAGMETSVTLHARDRFDFRQMDMAYFFLFMGVIVGGIQGAAIGPLAKRLGERRLVLIGMTAFTLGFVLVPSVFRVPLLYLVASLVAIGQGLSYTSLTSIISKAAPAAERGSILGFSSGLGSLARFIGPIAAGVLYDLAGPRGAFYEGAALTAAAFVVVLSMRRL